jgi:hypothetical protein
VDTFSGDAGEFSGTLPLGTRGRYAACKGVEDLKGLLETRRVGEKRSFSKMGGPERSGETEGL